MGLFGLLRRKRKLAEQIESWVDTDLDRAAEELAEHRRRLRSDDAGRLAALIRSKLQAREHVEYLSRALAEGSVSATAACELLETYREAGYVDAAQFGMLRRHVFEAHRREIHALLMSGSATRTDYFRAIDGYRAAGYLSDAELRSLTELLDLKLNPAKAARRLFGTARSTLDLDEQEDLLERYLLEFEGFPDYPDAASLYLALRVDQLWKALPSVRYAREAAVAVHELNNLLVAYLPFTGDIGDAVPIGRIVSDFMALARDFKPEPDVDGPITARDLRRLVVVTGKRDARDGSYAYERNQFVSIGAKGRVAAVRDDHVVVMHSGRGFPHSRSWPIAAFEGTQYARIQPKSTLAVWHQDELGLLRHRTPSPVFVHQFREAVRTMAELLERHREDRSLEGADGAEALTSGDGAAGLALD